MSVARQEIIEEYYWFRILVDVVFVLWIIIDILLKRLVSTYTINWLEM
jgi:nitric oxide reductase large subunit